MKKLLHLKSWQLFVLLFLIPILYFLVTYKYWIDPFDAESRFSYQRAKGNFVFPFDTQFRFQIKYLWFILPLIYIFMLTLQFGWLTTLGTNLFAKRPLGLKMKIGFFKLCIFYCFVYLFLLYFLKPLSDVGTYYIPLYDSPLNNFIIVPFWGLVNFFCSLFIIYFLSKLLVSIELREKTSLRKYFGVYLLFLVFPIGIWWLQPRISTVFGKTAASTSK